MKRNRTPYQKARLPTTLTEYHCYACGGVFWTPPLATAIRCPPCEEGGRKQIVGALCDARPGRRRQTAPSEAALF